MNALQYYLSTDHAVEIFKTWIGPTLNALGKIEKDQKKNLLQDLKAVFERYNRLNDGTAIVENIYLETVVFL